MGISTLVVSASSFYCGFCIGGGLFLHKAANQSASFVHVPGAGVEKGAQSQRLVCNLPEA